MNKWLNQIIMILNSVLLRSVLLGLFACGQAFGDPVITSFTPTAGAPGDQVQLTGSGFLSGSFVLQFWNGVTVTSGFVNSDTLITVVLPAGITTGPISIQQGTGTPLFTADNFLAVGNGPFITDFSPVAGSVNDTVVVNGVHLSNPIGVLFAGVNATQFNANAAGTQISTRVPNGATNGVITVSTPLGTSNSPTAFAVIGPGPYVTGFSPITGNNSTKVQITGLHFTGITNVTFNGQSGGGLMANSDTLLQIQPPVGVLTGPIGVSGPLGAFVTSSNFFANPTLTSLAPSSGRAGTNVTITGTNLLGASAVFFGSKASTTFTVQSNFKISAKVPTGATTGLIRVVTPAGSAFSPANFVILPTISGFSPAFGPVGTHVTVTGVNLAASTPTVQFNGVAASTLSSVTSTQVVAVVPMGATSGRISLTTSAGSDLTGTAFFLPATLSGFSPNNSAPGNRVVITGQNLTGTSAVRFNGTPATSFIVTNNSSLSAVVPANLVTGPISISAPAGSVTSSASFYGTPLISGFSPTHGLPGASVTVKGVNFLGGTVQFAGTPAALVSLNNTQMVATVPSGAVTGPITVSAPAGGASSTPFTLDYSTDLSIYITNSANPVTLGSNLVYTIVIDNRGPFDAPNATFTNILPSSVALVSASVSPFWQLATNGNVLTGSSTNFVNGASSTLLVTVQPLATGDITSSVSVSSDYPDPAPGDNTASIVTTVSPQVLLSVNTFAYGVKISWPLALTNYSLETRDVLTSDLSWSAVTNVPFISGEMQFILQTNTSSARFYRLHR